MQPAASPCAPRSPSAAAGRGDERRRRARGWAWSRRSTRDGGASPRPEAKLTTAFARAAGGQVRHPWLLPRRGRLQHRARPAASGRVVLGEERSVCGWSTGSASRGGLEDADRTTPASWRRIARRGRWRSGRTRQVQADDGPPLELDQAVAEAEEQMRPGPSTTPGRAGGRGLDDQRTRPPPSIPRTGSVARMPNFDLTTAKNTSSG